MLRFLLIFLLVYGSVNFYVFWKLRALLPDRLLYPRLLLGMFILIMVFGPLLVRLLLHANWERTATTLAFVSYSWMAVQFWFFCLGLSVDLWNGLCRQGRFVFPVAARWELPLRPAMAGIGIILLILTVWSVAEAWTPHVKRLTLRSPHLATGQPPLRILQISDLHLSLIERGRRLRHLLGVIDGLKPDLIVSTGDLVDGQGNHLDVQADQLAQVHPPLGKYAVLGNHEYYAGLGYSLKFHQRAGFRLLRGEAVPVNNILRLVGVDDPTGKRLGEDLDTQEASALAQDDPRRTTLLLKHQPSIREASLGRFALQLSGHTHGGQIFPFGWLVRTRFQYLAGYHALGRDSALYISCGTGTWGPPMRLGAPPEVTLITLVPADAPLS